MKKKFYLSAPIDEIVLKNDLLEKYPQILKEIPTRDQILEIQKANSIDFASMALYQGILNSPRYSPFIDKISAQKIPDTKLDKLNCKWILLPAMVYEDFPEVGAGGEHIISAATQMGIQMERLPTGGKKGVIHNAKLIKAWVDENPSTEFGIASMSKGSLEFRYAYTYLFSDGDRARLKYWVNFSGFFNGNALADTFLNDWKNKLYTEIVIRIIKLDKKAITESRSDFEAWKTPLVVEKHTKVFSLFPIPLSSHVQSSLMGRFKRLSCFGPNDGMAECYRAPYWDGEIYPLWGADHFCRTPEMIYTLYKLFSHIRETN